MEMWEAWYCQDGVTVFFGTNKENQDVLMVSLTVRGPPNLVTEVELHRPLPWSHLLICIYSVSSPPCLSRQGRKAYTLLKALCIKDER